MKDNNVCDCGTQLKNRKDGKGLFCPVCVQRGFNQLKR